MRTVFRLEFLVAEIFSRNTVSTKQLSMLLINLSASFLALLICSLIITLEHEKSFLVQDGASVVHSVALYKDSLLLSSSNDFVQKDIETGAIQRTFRAHTGIIRSFLVTNDSRMITSAWDDMIVIWNLEPCSVVKRILLRSSGTLIFSISLQNNVSFAGGDNGLLRRIDLMTDKVTIVKSKQNVSEN
jgi:WD40 repeat protein